MRSEPMKPTVNCLQVFSSLKTFILYSTSFTHFSSFLTVVFFFFFHFSAPATPHCEEFVVSVVLGKDVVPR